MGPEIGYISTADFSTLGSMQVVCFALSTANTDTLVEAMGQFFPAENEILPRNCPISFLMEAVRLSSNMLGGGDGDDSNDVEYRFFFSAFSGLQRVDENNGIEAQISTGDVYVEREGVPRSVRLDISQSPAGLYPHT